MKQPRMPNHHFAVLTSPVPGHLNPVQVLASKLIATGARVTVVHVEGARRFVTEPAVGFAPLPDCVSAPDALDRFLAVLAQPTGIAGVTRTIRATAAMTDALLSGAPDVLARIGADVVLADAVEPAGPLIARHMMLPLVTAVTGLPLLRDDSVPPPFLSWKYRPGAWGRFHNRGGYAVADALMQPITRVLDARRRAWGLEGEAEPLIQVAQCPRALDFPRAGLPANFRYTAPWRHPTEADVAIEVDDRPLVFCSLGTLQGSRYDLLANIASACAAVGARAIIGHGGGLSAEQEADLPGDPLVRAFWPQEAVLRHCAAAVLHGGFNSVLDALAAGVPIVALPIAFEQPGTAARIAHSGVGVVVPSSQAATGRLAAALERVLNQPTHRAAARIMAADIAAAGGASSAAAAINAALAAPAGCAAASTRGHPD